MKRALAKEEDKRLAFNKKELAISIPMDEDVPEKIDELDEEQRIDSVVDKVESFSPTQKREGGSLAIADPLLGLTLQGQQPNHRIASSTATYNAPGSTRSSTSQNQPVIFVSNAEGDFSDNGTEINRGMDG